MEELGMEPAGFCFHHTKREFAMLRLLMGATALAIVTLPASAQTTAPSGGGQVTAPSGQNSGAGIPGKPGSKSRPRSLHRRLLRARTRATTIVRFASRTRPRFLGNLEARVAHRKGHPLERSSREGLRQYASGISEAAPPRYAETREAAWLHSPRAGGGSDLSGNAAFNLPSTGRAASCEVGRCIDAQRSPRQ
jgi:hypothetical protein